MGLAWKSLASGASANDGGDMKYLGLGPMALAGVLSASCASTPPPTEKAASSEAAVRTAEEIGARNVPQAGLYLDLAQKELDHGKALMRAGQNQEAASAFAMSQADADVALALARESRTRMAAQETKARAQALRQGIPGAAVGGGPTQPTPPVTPPRTPAPAPVHPTPMTPPSAEPPAPMTPPSTEPPAKPHP